jgi:hypothetical protein
MGLKGSTRRSQRPCSEEYSMPKKFASTGLHRTLLTGTTPCSSRTPLKRSGRPLRRMQREFRAMSIVVELPGKEARYRRLTVGKGLRCWDSDNIPVLGASYSQKLRMIGNAFPPARYVLNRTRRSKGLTRRKVRMLSHFARSWHPRLPSPPQTSPTAQAPRLQSNRQVLVCHPEPSPQKASSI